MLNMSIDRLDQIKQILPAGMSLSELALKYILQNDVVSTVIPGMSKINHAKQNLEVSNGIKLSDELYQKLKSYRWNRDIKVFNA